MEKDKNNINANWENITYAELIELYVKNNYTDSMVAELYNVTKSKVAYKRKKLGISKADIIYKRFISGEDSEAFNNAQNTLKNNLMNTDISVISRAIVHYAFRNGPVENMHSDGKLSENDMKILNKYMNNKIATLLTLLKEKDWIRFALIVELFGVHGIEWDEPEIGIDELNKLLELKIK